MSTAVVGAMSHSGLIEMAKEMPDHHTQKGLERHVVNVDCPLHNGHRVNELDVG